MLLIQNSLISPISCNSLRTAWTFIHTSVVSTIPYHTIPTSMNEYQGSIVIIDWFFTSRRICSCIRVTSFTPNSVEYGAYSAEFDFLNFKILSYYNPSFHFLKVICNWLFTVQGYFRGEINHFFKQESKRSNKLKI